MLKPRPRAESRGSAVASWTDGGDGVLVVLDEEADRQRPGGGEVHRLQRGADVGGAVAEVGHRDRVGAGLPVRPGEAGGLRDAAADDGVGAHRAGLLPLQVHRAAAAVGPAAVEAADLGQRAQQHVADLVGRRGERVEALGLHVVQRLGQELVVAAVRAVDGVLAGEREHRADRAALLADAGVRRAVDQAGAGQLEDVLLEGPDPHQLGVASCAAGRGRRRPSRRRWRPPRPTARRAGEGGARAFPHLRTGLDPKSRVQPARGGRQRQIGSEMEYGPGGEYRTRPRLLLAVGGARRRPLHRPPRRGRAGVDRGAGGLVPGAVPLAARGRPRRRAHQPRQRARLPFRTREPAGRGRRRAHRGRRRPGARARAVRASRRRPRTSCGAPGSGSTSRRRASRWRCTRWPTGSGCRATRTRWSKLGSTPRRLEALLAGDCDATMLNAGNELVAERPGRPAGRGGRASLAVPRHRAASPASSTSRPAPALAGAGRDRGRAPRRRRSRRRHRGGGPPARARRRAGRALRRPAARPARRAGARRRVDLEALRTIVHLRTTYLAVAPTAPTSTPARSTPAPACCTGPGPTDDRAPLAPPAAAGDGVRQHPRPVRDGTDAGGDRARPRRAAGRGRACRRRLLPRLRAHASRCGAWSRTGSGGCARCG